MNEYVKGIYDLISHKGFYMLGAENICYSNKENSLRFKISGSTNYNYIKITYESGHDLYTIEFFKIREVNHEVKTVNYMKYEMMGVENVRELITDETGLYLSIDAGFNMEEVYTYTWNDLINDGSLVDLSALYPNDTNLYKWPVACTRELWDLIKETDEPGFFVWDMCYMSINAPGRKMLSESIVLFPCFLPLKTNKLKTKQYWLKLVIEPGDNGEPVITILFKDQS